jgi:hypothetical protein
MMFSPESLGTVSSWSTTGIVNHLRSDDQGMGLISRSPKSANWHRNVLNTWIFAAVILFVRLETVC